MSIPCFFALLPLKRNPRPKEQQAVVLEYKVFAVRLYRREAVHRAPKWFRCLRRTIMQTRGGRGSSETKMKGRALTPFHGDEGLCEIRRSTTTEL